MSEVKLDIFFGTCSPHKVGPNKKMKLFGQGAQKHGVSVNYIRGYTDYPTALSKNGLMFGSVRMFEYNGKNKFKALINDFRKFLCDKYSSNDKNLFFLDTDILRYYDPTGRFNRYPMNSIYYNEAEWFVDGGLDKERIKKFKHIRLHDRPRGDKILLFLNRTAGHGAKESNPFEWAYDTISELRKYTDRKIIVRPHNESDKNLKKWSKSSNIKNCHWLISKIQQSNIKNTFVKTWEDASMEELLNDAWAVVSFATTASAIPLIQNLPIFVTSEISFMYDFRAGELKDIENPKEVDREMFLHRYANLHWSESEVESGIFWERVKDKIR